MHPGGKPNTSRDTATQTIPTNITNEVENYIMENFDKILAKYYKVDSLAYNGGPSSTFTFPKGKTISNGKIKIIEVYTLYQYDNIMSGPFPLSDMRNGLSHIKLNDDSISYSNSNYQTLYWKDKFNIHFKYIEFP